MVSLWGMLTRKVSTIKIKINDARNTIAARRSAVDPSEVGNFALEGFSKFAISLAPPGSRGFLPRFVAANSLTPRGGFTPLNRNANASQKLVKQENFTHRPDVIGPIRPAVRNAIGQPIQPRSVMVETPRMSPSVQAPGLVPKPITRSVAAPQVSPSPIRRGTFHPVTTAGVSSAGSTGGTRLIRPWAGPVGIGGPAHPVGGINGTTVRTTR